MKTTIDKNEIMALFFLSYFRYTKVAFKKSLSESDKGEISGYKALMRMLGEKSKFPKIKGSDLIGELKQYSIESDNDYVCGFAGVMNEMIHFIYERVLSEEKEHRLLERYA